MHNVRQVTLFFKPKLYVRRDLRRPLSGVLDALFVMAKMGNLFRFGYFGAVYNALLLCIAVVHPLPLPDEGLAVSVVLFLYLAILGVFLSPSLEREKEVESCQCYIHNKHRERKVDIIT